MFFVYFCQTIGKEEKTSDMRIEEILAMEIDDRQFCRTEIQADDVERVLRAALLATCGKEGNSVELYPVEEIVKPLSWKHRQPWRCPQW